MNDTQIRKRIQAEYQAYLRGVKAYDYNGMFTKFLLRSGKIKPNKEKWTTELIPLAVEETESEIISHENKRGEIETYTDEKGVLRSYGITEERLQNDKYQEILRDFFKTQKENNVKYIYELEEML